MNNENLDPIIRGDLKTIAERLKDRELFPEKIKNAKEYLKGLNPLSESEEEKAVREQMWIDYLHRSLWKFDKEKVIEIFKEQQKYYDFSWRIVREDDSHYIVTHDLKPNRINLEFDNNYLSKSYLG